MREILFRGKRIDNGEWLEGSFLNDRDGSFYICPAVSDISYGDGGNRRRIGCWYKVDPSTVGQYTGLKDKNGKRIFEGDILCFDKTVFVCYWDGGNIEFGLRNNEESIGMAYVAVYDAEIIGNVHDNSELL